MEIERDRLVQIMVAAGAGEAWAATALFVELGPHLCRVMRSHLRSFGVHDVQAHEVEGLALDAALELFDHAGAWRPDGGALPWVWAERRLRALASRFVGQWADELDEAAHVVEAEPLLTGSVLDDPDELETLLGLTGERADARLLFEALEASTGTRNQQILLAYRQQAHFGDPSPANTVGARFAMQPAAVRQVVKRTSDRLKAHLAADPVRYAALADLAIAA